MDVNRHPLQVDSDEEHADDSLRKDLYGGSRSDSKAKDAVHGSQSGADMYENTDQENESLLTSANLEDVVGPVKEEFEELRRKINENQNELEGLEKEFYSKVSSKAVELEGVGKEEDAEIERHRHLFEMMQLTKLEKRMRQMEKEKLALLKME